MSFDMGEALAAIHARLDAAEQDDIDRITTLAAQSVAAILARDCPTDAVRMTHGNAIVRVTSALGNYAGSCPHAIALMNLQSAVGYYLMTGVPHKPAH